MERQIFQITPATGERCMVDHCPTFDRDCKRINLNSIMLASLILCHLHLEGLQKALSV